MISQDDNDHNGGLQSVLDNLAVNQVLTSYAVENGSDAVDVEHCVAGQRWEWDGVLFEMLSPSPSLYAQSPKDNDKSCVIKITSQAGSMLLTGDIEKKVELGLIDELNGDQLQSTVLLVPHHGSRTSWSEEWVHAVNPKHAVIANGYLNRFKHPNAKVLEGYHDKKISIYRTDIDGAIRLEFKNDEKSHRSGVEVTKWQTTVPRYWRDSVESSL